MSRSELHNWECTIESLSGENADKLLAIARDIYNTAFVRGKDSMSLVTPQRPKGKWILYHPLQADDPGAYMCSICGCGDWGLDPKIDKFCFNCGADMRESEDKNG